MKLFGRRKVLFDDSRGLSFHGMWCAPVTVEEGELPETDSFKELQAIAKMSAVAIPLWYVIGKNQPNSNKYCVITNWWRYRMPDGSYQLPTLVPELYKSVQADFDIEAMFQAASSKPRRGQKATKFGTL